jgi:integrase
VTEEHIEIVMAALDRDARKRLGRRWRQGSKRQAYQVLRRLFDLAIKPGRLRTDNPVSTDLRPGKDHPKLFGYLYPSELLAVLKCESIPIARRVLYALAVYTGLRKSSLYALTWDCVDFQHGTLTSVESQDGAAADV